MTLKENVCLVALEISCTFLCGVPVGNVIGLFHFYIILKVLHWRLTISSKHATTQTHSVEML